MNIELAICRHRNLLFVRTWWTYNLFWKKIISISIDRWRLRVMVLNTTFSNISVILWGSVLLVEETGENHRPAASHWQTLSQCCIKYTSPERDSNSQLQWMHLLGKLTSDLKRMYSFYFTCINDREIMYDSEMMNLLCQWKSTNFEEACSRQMWHFREQ
jgi:hypothetical protein